MDRLNFTKLFIILSYTICWFSISTTINDLFIFNKNTLTTNDMINFMRHILVYICLFLSLILIFFNNPRDILKKNMIMVFFSLYFLAQIPGLFLTSNSIENISFIISGITITYIIILVNEFFSFKEKKIIIFISLIILVSVFCLSFSGLFQEYLEGKNNLYGHFNPNTDLFFNKDSPRSSGLSRSCLIILLTIYSIENLINKNAKIILIFFKILLLTVILLYQSRTIIFLTFLSHIFIYIYEYKISFKYLIKFLSYYLLLPLLLAFLLMDYYSKKKNKIIIDNTISKYGSLEIIEKKEIKKIFPIRKFANFSSGRFDD